VRGLRAPADDVLRSVPRPRWRLEEFAAQDASGSEERQATREGEGVKKTTRRQTRPDTPTWWALEKELCEVCGCQLPPRLVRAKATRCLRHRRGVGELLPPGQMTRAQFEEVFKPFLQRMLREIDEQDYRGEVAELERRAGGTDENAALARAALAELKDLPPTTDSLDLVYDRVVTTRRYEQVARRYGSELATLFRQSRGIRKHGVTEKQGHAWIVNEILNGNDGDGGIHKQAGGRLLGVDPTTFQELVEKATRNYAERPAPWTRPAFA
jgi:hypothetical protein